MKTLKKLVISFSFLFAVSALMAQSVLQHGEWAKVQVSESGVYKISYEDVVAMGFAQPASIQIFGNGVGELPLMNTGQLPQTLHEIAIFTSFASGTKFSAGDYVLFYADVPRNWQFNEQSKQIEYAINSYTTQNNYFIRINSGEEPLRVQPKAQETGIVSKTISTYDNVQIHEKDETNVLKSGRVWLEALGEKTLSFTLPNLVETEYVTMKTRLAARHTSTATFDVAVNGEKRNSITVGGISSGSDAYANLREAVDNFYVNGNSVSIKITTKFSGVDSKQYLDYCMLLYRAKLSFTQGQLVFRNYTQRIAQAAGRYEITAPANAQVWNVSNPEQPQIMSLTYNNGKAVFDDDISQVAEYVAFSQDFKKPVFVKKIQNQNILAHTGANMVIVCADALRPEAQKIADLHAGLQGLKTVIVSQQEIFNEFSGGRPDPTALRNYFRYVWQKGGKLQYALLFGDASYDNRTFREEQIPVICFQSLESMNAHSTFVTDDFFGLLQAGTGVRGNDLIGNLDIAVGRMPVNTLAEARAVLQKLLNYTTSPNNRGDWQNYITFLADDAGGNQTMHATGADKLSKQIAAQYPQFNFDKIYLDAYKQVSNSSGKSYPDAVRAVNERMIKGSLVFNYTGHGHYTRMSKANVVTLASVELWKNSTRLPLVITASCEISRFDNDGLSLGEKLFLQKDGGAIALFSTTRTVYANSNDVLNSRIFNYLFEKDETGAPLSIGEALRRAKNSMGDEQNKRKFALLGNPALQLAVPQHKVILDSIDNSMFAEFNDTLRANQKVRLVGSIQNHANEKLTSYNGELLITVFDKSQMVETLSNDDPSGADKIKFEVQKNILFRGLATVTNGQFEANIIIPQDISYFAGDGKISFFANNGHEQAAGSCFIPINGSVESEKDVTPPTVEMFLNSYDFVNGGITNENPLLLVKLFSPSGINISDVAVGHSILLIIDGDERNPIVLNDYYVADRDTYTSGTLSYQLLQLSEGEHTIKLRVWDTQNNMTEETLQFYVVHSTNFSLARVYAYPNPTTDVINISFEHNQANEQLNVTLFVYDMMGNKVAQIQQEMTAQAKNVMQWNCQRANGTRLQGGIYNCVLRINSPQGMQQVAVPKIIVQ
ncbi:MAG: type IX secretion system sortase PorU [Bacteroidetes bacterium]|nr:type IX secretion system sortase PorU [Bacteroidota bacterium]